MRILVAEDDAVLAEGLTRLLTKAGHGVDRVKDGRVPTALRATPYELWFSTSACPTSTVSRCCDGCGSAVRKPTFWS